MDATLGIILVIGFPLILILAITVFGYVSVEPE